MIPQRTRVKVCGITSAKDAALAIEAGADALGFIHYPASKRHIAIDTIASICATLPPFVSLVALVVDPDASLIEKMSCQTPIHCFQFHGNESPEFLAQMTMPYYKKISLDKLCFDQAVINYPKAQALLADTPTPLGAVPGGTGTSFDWSHTKRTSNTPLILAGGLGPDNIIQAILQTHPYAVDVNSGVEQAPGIKDKDKLRQLINNLRQADQQMTCN